MKYEAKQPKNNVVIPLTFGFTYMITTLGDSLFITTLFGLSIFICLVGLMVRYEFFIEEDELFFKVKIFNIVVFSKHLRSTEIQQIHFKRYGWATKGASIIVKKGMNLRILHFKQQEVLSH
ncbi:hypothetical protein [Lysinibacillus piscis]|uniref:Pore-forming protein n=1 Tax=Lysinibacillus piscis TaxID=2518931 RepID=A0ABQ5NNR6_9BACI|nr:hypothetical protein [Lysinibacillus sp. KH24]GLC90026.1 hypothetical protein LYSBPC_31530 [Lysinibacillus sp. KH24]